jgi:hypothetical protein
MKCLADQLLRNIRPIGIGSVHEIDAKRRELVKRLEHLGAVFWFPPDSWARDPHRAKADAIDLNLATNTKSASLASVDH